MQNLAKNTSTRPSSQISQKSGHDAASGQLGLPTTTLLAFVVFALAIAFVLGMRIGRKSASRARTRSLPIDDNRTVQVSAETGVEVIYNKNGYRIRVEKTSEHRYLAERCFGRALESDEVVHHINGRRSDNRLENLCVLHYLKHEQYHAWLKWKKDKEGQYPSDSVLRGILVKEYGGVILGGDENESRG